MMSATGGDQLHQAKVRLVEALGEKRTKYFHHLRQWFRMRVSRL